MVQIFLLTGFLGAGKTTMLQKLLENTEKQRVGVIINEFGAVNVDAKLVQADGVQMAELSNGSIFCACIRDKFLDSLIEMSKNDLDVMFIEASGLADPSNMGKILDAIAPKTVHAYQMAGSICIVDAVHFSDMIDLLPALERQIQYAGAVIINKADLVDADLLKSTMARVQEINPDVQPIFTSYCNVDLETLTGLMTPVKRESVDTTNTFESRPPTFVLKAREVLPAAGLDRFLRQIAPESYRIKGFAMTDEGNRQISAVSEQILLQDWKQPLSGTELVAISSSGMKLLSTILAASKEHVDGRIGM